MAYKNYKIKDNWLDIDKYNVVDVQSVDGVIQGVKVNGEDAGGGGGDFSTATMNIVINDNVDLNISCAFLRRGKIMGGTFKFSQDTSITIVLYKGTALIDLTDNNLSIYTSGAITSEGSGTYTASGDCTITAESAPA